MAPYINLKKDIPFRKTVLCCIIGTGNHNCARDTFHLHECVGVLGRGTELCEHVDVLKHIVCMDGARESALN